MNKKKLMFFALSAFLITAGCGDDESGNSTTNTATNNATTNNSAENNSAGNNGGTVSFTVDFSNQSGGDPIDTFDGNLISVTGADNVRPVILLSGSGGGQFQITWTKEAGPLMPGTIETEGTFTSPDGLQCTTPTVDGEVLTLELTSTDPAAGTFSGLLRCDGGAFTVDASGSFED